MWCAKGFEQVLPGQTGLREKASACYVAAGGSHANYIKQMQIHKSVTGAEDQQAHMMNNSLTIVYVYTQYMESDNRRPLARFRRFSKGNGPIRHVETCPDFFSSL
jgi:hypothetical protein